MTFVKQHKHHLGAFVILIIIATVSGYFAFSTPNKTQNTTNKTRITKNTKADSTTTSDIKVDSQQFNNFPPEAGPPLAETMEQSVNKVTLRINDKDYQTKFVSSTTVLDLMEEMQFEHKISFSGKEYPGMGMFVEEINGVKNDNLAGKYWIYYVNGQSAQVGISNYIFKPDDVIEWKYETPDF